MIAIDGQEVWTCDDEIWLQDQMDERDQHHQEKQAAIQFAKRIWQRYQEDVTLLVEHAFGGLQWEILYELPDSPYFYLCECANGFQQAFHASELTTRNNR